MKLTPGSRWKSAVSEAEFVLVRAPSAEGELACGGVAVLATSAERPAPGAAPEGESLLGKRYTDVDTGLEVLCSKPGKGALSFGGRLLTIKEAKRLPSSD
jgi:hypothetical protein